MRKPPRRLEKEHESTRKTLSQASKQALLRYSGRTHNSPELKKKKKN